MWCVEGGYFQKAKDCTNSFESYLLVVWAIDVDVICKDARGLSKGTNEMDITLLSCHCYLKLSLIN